MEAKRQYGTKEFSSEELRIDGKIIIPTYQRGLVWKLKKRKEFLDTVFKGYPFGVILVYEKDGKYEVVDGLQRLSTMKAYMDKPLDFIGVNDTLDAEEELDCIVEKKLKNNGKRPDSKSITSGRKNLKKKIIDYVKKIGKPKSLEVWKYLSTDYGFDQNDMDTYEHFEKFYDRFMEELKFPIIQIPAIVYSGSYDDLPDVFQRLNTGSVKLTKYEIFASIWNDNKILINDDEIIEKVMGKYQTLEESSSFDVNFTESDLIESGITLFEYCYALSEILNDEAKPFSKLFPGEKKSTDPTGFEVLALVCGLPVNNSNELIKKEYLGQKTPVFLINLKNALIDCVTFLYSSLKEYIVDIKGTAIPNDSTYQVYHMILSVFKNSYDMDLATQTITSKDTRIVSKWRNSFSKNAFGHYIFDTLTQYWSKNRQVSDLDGLIKNTAALGKYTQKVTKEDFSEGISEYCKDLHTKAIKRTVDNTSKLLLNCYYKLSIDEDRNRAKYFEQQDNVFFDIEHITPVEKFGKNTNKLPISALGNLCYLPVKDNRSKRDKTIYQYADERPSLTQDKSFLKLIDYPSKNELEFIEYQENEFEKHYKQLIDKRENELCNRIMSLLYKGTR